MKFKVLLEYEACSQAEFDSLSFKTLNKTTSFELAIKIDQTYSLNTSTSFIKYFKQNGYISSYDLKFEFYDKPTYDKKSEEDEVGRLIFGEFETLYNTKKYPSENLRVTKLISYSNSIDYRVYVTSVYIQIPGSDKQIQLTSQNIEFVFDRSAIIGVKDYKESIETHFFNKYEGGRMCEKKQVDNRFGYRSSIIDVFECNPGLISKYKKDFPKLMFYLKDLDFTFEFNYEDLFREVNGKVYFLVIFPSYKEEPLDCEVGKIFFKK